MEASLPVSSALSLSFDIVLNYEKRKVNYIDKENLYGKIILGTPPSSKMVSV